MSRFKALLFLLIAASTLSPAASQAMDLRDYSGKLLSTYIECGIRTGAVDCEAMTSGFFATFGSYFERAKRRQDAVIRVNITDQAVDGGPTQFTFAWNSDDSLTVSNFTYVVKINTAILDRLAVLNELIASIGKGASSYLQVISGEENETGQVVITSGEAAPEKPPSKFETGPYYVNLYASGYGSKNGANKSFYGYAGASLNYSTDKVRLILGSDIGSTKITVPSDTGTLSATDNTISAYSTAAYSIKKRWSVALLGRYSKDPGQNIKGDYLWESGLEWNLVPYRTTENNEVYFRVGGGLRDLNLYSENDHGFQEKQYALIFAQIYASWALFQSKANATLSGSVTSYPKFSGYQIYSGSGSVFYQITPAIQINGKYVLSYQKKSLTYPKTPDYSNPLQTMYLTGAPGVGSYFSFGVNVSLGNSLRKTRDRRWTQ